MQSEGYGRPYELCRGRGYCLDLGPTKHLFWVGVFITDIVENHCAGDSRKRTAC